MNPSLPPTSPWVMREPSLLVGLNPAIAYRFGNAAVDGNELESRGADQVNSPFIYRSPQEVLGIATDVNQAAQLAASRSENPLLDLGKGVALTQSYDVSSILAKPVETVKILGAKTLPEPNRLITSAATFIDAYFQEVSLIKNQPMLLDAQSLRTDANGQTQVIKFWYESGVESLNEEMVGNYFADPAKYFTYVRLTAIDGSDALRDSLAMPSPSEKVKPGVPTGVPAAIIPTATLLTSIFQSMPSIDVEMSRANLPLIVEEAISKTLLQHPMLCGLNFKSAVFHVAVGIPLAGTEIVIVTLDRNEVQATQAERDAFNKVYGDLGNVKVAEAAKKKKEAAEKSATNKKGDSISSILKSPFVLGLDQPFNVAEPSADASAAAAAPVVVKTPTEQEMADSALAKWYSDGLYVATIVYKKNFDVTHATDALAGFYYDWILGAQPQACGTYAPHAARKISMSVIRSAFARGITPPNVEGMQNYASRVDTFLGLKLGPLLERYNPVSGAFDYYEYSIGGGRVGPNFYASGIDQPPVYKQPQAAPSGAAARVSQVPALVQPSGAAAARASQMLSTAGQPTGPASSPVRPPQSRVPPAIPPRPTSIRPPPPPQNRQSPVAEKLSELAPVVQPVAAPSSGTTLADFDRALASERATRPPASTRPVDQLSMDELQRALDSATRYNEQLERLQASSASPTQKANELARLQALRASPTRSSPSRQTTPIASSSFVPLEPTIAAPSQSLGADRAALQQQLDTLLAQNSEASAELSGFPRPQRGQSIDADRQARINELNALVANNTKRIKAINRLLGPKAPRQAIPQDVLDQLENS